MEIIQDLKVMPHWADTQRLAGRTIALVPTMGFFHSGHIDLMNHGREMADRVVVSLFVNPLQFGAGEDFEKYPRDFERDRQLAEEAGVDVLFIPRHEDLYPKDYQTYISVERVTQGLCGASRPGHFRGVATIVCKLFQLVKPHKAIFGLKDYQQVITIKQMVLDLNMDVEVIGRPTVREADGLALSSRNVYLSAEDRKAALSLFESLTVAQDRCRQGEWEAGSILAEATRILTRHPGNRIDYAKIVDPHTLKDLETINPRGILVLAVRVGQTRLIDNGLLEVN
ncbi:MAG: pantoate--beta-alanine ligase [Desulfobacteraceae bacterium]|nr:MAG: pantoate--beta-alanine ligase [Desulfobacteraceae bacterium]